MTRRQLPNMISIFRILLVLPIVWALLTEQFALAAFLFVVAGVSDALDGFLAKRYQWESRLGSILDPVADKLLLLSSLLTLAWLNLIPHWLVWLAVARDVMIVVGGVAYHHLIGRFSLVPLWSSKINTVSQIALVGLVICQQLNSVFNSAVMVMVWLVTASILISGSEYILVWGVRAWQQSRQQQQNK